MARIQPVLTPAELSLIDQMAALTGSKRTEVIKSALTVYHWFVRQALTGSRVVARKPSGPPWSRRIEFAGEAARGSLESRGGADQRASHSRSLRDLGPGIQGVPRVRRQNVPPALFHHLLDRVQSRKIPASQLELLAKWLDSEPEAPDAQWYKRFSA